MAWTVLVHNGVLQLYDPGSAAVFLQSKPPGAYTTTCSANNATSLLLWDRHLTRFSQSIKLLDIGLPQSFLHQPSQVLNDKDSLKALMQPSLEVGIKRAMEMRKDGEEFVVTAYVCGSAITEEEKGLDMFVHISRYTRHPIGTVPSAHLAVMGPGRIFPNAKYSQWVSARQGLEQARPSHVTEILLSNDGNVLLEGIATNFFVVCSTETNAKDEGMGEILVEGSKVAWKDIVVQTAPLQGVLPGVIRQLILEICAERGIPYCEVSPSWTNRHLWKEAFVTNSVRIIHPVKSIQAPREWPPVLPSENWKEIAWEYAHFEAPGHVTKVIQKLVWECSLAESIPMSTFFS